MSQDVEAVYENGLLKLDRLLPLADGQKVRITVHDAPSLLGEPAPPFQWKGSLEDLDYLIDDPENHPWHRS